MGGERGGAFLLLVRNFGEKGVWRGDDRGLSNYSMTVLRLCFPGWDKGAGERSISYVALVIVASGLYGYRRPKAAKGGGRLVSLLWGSGVGWEYWLRCLGMAFSWCEGGLGMALRGEVVKLGKSFCGLLLICSGKVLYAKSRVIGSSRTWVTLKYFTAAISFRQPLFAICRGAWGRRPVLPSP